MGWWSTLLPWGSEAEENPIDSRGFRSGDEERIVSLWGRTLEEYGGFIPRTVERWRWSVLERPGVTEEDIRILESRSGDLLGYGVLDATGTVLEFAVDGHRGEGQRARIADRLVRCLEERAEERDLDRLSLRLPSDDPVLRSVLRDRDYRAEPTESFQLVFVDLAGFLRRLLEHRGDELGEAPGTTYRLELRPDSYRFAPHQEIGITLGPPPEVSLEPEGDEAGCVVSCDLPTLAEVVFGRMSVRESLESGAVAVAPEGASKEAMELLRLLSVRAPWYSPPSDGI